MKKRHLLLAALSLLFLACPAGGQESPRTRIGIGIGLSDVRELLRLSSVEGGGDALHPHPHRVPFRAPDRA
jgi:hypothetical protein